LLGDEDRRMWMAQAAAAAAGVGGAYSWDESARLTVQLYEQLTGARDRPAPQSAPS